MNMPWGLIAIFFALSLFYYVSRQTKARNEERRDRLNESRQAYLDSLLKKGKSETRREGEEEDETHSPDKLDHE